MSQINRIKNPTILDCTLRDGSYVIDFQFTKEDTFIIASNLCEAGFEYIEVGHGVGLGASKKGFDVAAATDGGTRRAGSETLPERTTIRKQLLPALSQPTSAIAPAPHLTTRSADGRPVGPSRELTAPWYPKAI